MGFTSNRDDDCTGATECQWQDTQKKVYGANVYVIDMMVGDWRCCIRGRERNR